jgi:predicted secreted hydrolase
VEWWYCYALLTGSLGNKYAVMASFFRVGELAAPKGHYLIHSLVHLNDRRFECHSEVDRMLSYQMAGVYLPAYLIKNPRDKKTWKLYNKVLQGSLPSPHRFLKNATVQSRPMRIAYGDNRMTFDNDSNSDFELRLTSPASRVRLNYTPTKPIALIDEAGVLNGLRYYSATRNRVSGEIISGEITEKVSGDGWFDHQWGRNYGLLLGEGWDWFGIQLQDGNELLINQLRHANEEDKTEKVAKLILKDGSVITSDRVTIEPTKHWDSRLTAGRYPAEWLITLPDYAMELCVTPILANQEMSILGPLQAIWEGVVSVTGKASSPYGTPYPINGYGFVELVGYAR